jgi:CMP-N-acetylneuraminic acid synthetase
VIHNRAASIVSEHCIAILVLARSCSKRVSNKNYRPFVNDMSLVDLKIETLLSVFPHNNVFISSDVIDLRCKNLRRSTDSIVNDKLPFTDVITPLYNELKNKGFKHVLITYPTSPLFNEEMYKRVIYDYYVNVIFGDKDSAVTGFYNNGYFWLGDKEVNYEATAYGHAYTQNNEQLFNIDNAVYIKKLEFTPMHYMFNRESVHFIEIPKLFGLDVDSKEDFVIAKELYKAYEANAFEGVY